MNIEDIDRFIFFQKRLSNKKILNITKIILKDFIAEKYLPYQNLIITNSREIEIALECREKIKDCLYDDVFKFISKFTECALLLSSYTKEQLQNLVNYILKLDERLFSYQEVHEIASILFKENKCFNCNKDIITYFNEEHKSFDLHCMHKKYYLFISSIWITVCHNCHFLIYHKDNEKEKIEDQNVVRSLDFFRRIVNEI